MIDLSRTCGHAVRARRCLRRQLELPPPQHLWPGCEVRSPPMLAAKIDRPIRHADVLSKYPGVSCQSSLHLNNRRRRRRRWCCVEMQRRCRQPRSPLGGQGHRCGLREPGRRRRLEPNRGPRLVRPVLTRTTSKLYFRRAVYVCGGHELSDEKRSVRSWITNVIHQILLRFHQMNHGYGVAASVACWLW